MRYQVKVLYQGVDHVMEARWDGYNMFGDLILRWADEGCISLPPTAAFSVGAGPLRGQPARKDDGWIDILPWHRVIAVQWRKNG